MHDLGELGTVTQAILEYARRKALLEQCDVIVWRLGDGVGASCTLPAGAKRIATAVYVDGVVQTVV